ncbi:MAG: T9SS type A sorting domain-containing protein [Bacteroidota bacterium]
MMRYKYFCSLIFLCISHFNGFSQGYTSVWQLGYNAGPPYSKSVLNFNSGLAIIDSINRPMNFSAEEAAICDSNGELLFYTNGIYVANRNHVAMPNGSGLNPGLFTDDWNNDGLPIFQGALILPWPDQYNKYLLIHETLDYNANIHPTTLYYSLIDMNLAGGLGDIYEKNDTLLERYLDWGGITACKHANGRDWWVLVHKHATDYFYKILITPLGLSIDSQSVGGINSDYGGTSLFSSDGNWFATFDNLSKLRLYNFDRCTGLLNNFQYINLIPDSVIAGGLSFSPKSNFLYVSSLTEVYQYDLNAANIISSKKTIAIYDGYYSPSPPFESTFLFHMLGPDGKIYINSGSSVVDLHVINFPDSLDTLCNLQQHSIHLPGFNKNTLPNHINYWLGPENGSPCDTILTVQEKSINNFNLLVTPNPVTSQTLKIFYRMPQHLGGLLEVIDINGKSVYKYQLPMWSTQQSLTLPNLSSGLYAVSLTAGNNRVVRKIMIE